MSSFVLSGAVPTMPLVFWGVRQRNRQLDSSALAERLKAHVEKLWEKRAGRRGGQCADDELTRVAGRDFQPSGVQSARLQLAV